MGKTTKTAFVNARLLDPASGLDDTGAILVEGKQIADFGPGLFSDSIPSGIDVIDCGGQCLAPGLVDMRAGVGEPGFEHKETIRTAGEAAVAGGVTTLACLPDADPVIDNVSGVEFIARRAREARLAKIYPLGAATRGMLGKDLTEIGLLSEAGAVAFTDIPKAIASTKVMRRALSYASTYGQVIIQHPEEPELAENGHMNGGEIATRLGLNGIPRAAEVMMIERDLRLLEMTGGRYHVANVSTREAIDAIRRAKKQGLDVTCDTAPPYFALTEVDIGDYRTFLKLSPPLRDEMDRRAVVEGLADGTIDAICSDHRPEDQDSKRQPFTQASFGAIGLETMLPIALELAHNNKLDLLDLLRCLTTAPADILRIDDNGHRPGRLAKGGAADIVIFDAERPWKINADDFRSKSWNSPFDGRPVSGKVLMTMIDGRTVFSDPEFDAARDSGSARAGAA